MAENRQHISIAHAYIEKRCDLIKTLIDGCRLFKEDIEFNYLIQPYPNTSSLQIKFYITRAGLELAYCSTAYITNPLQQLDHANILFVQSTIGYSTGVFLLYMQLLICFSSNISIVTLDNYTNDPARAAQGIYKQFQVNKRGKLPNEFKGKNLAEQLHASEGGMYLRMTPNLLRGIIDDLNKISDKVSVNSNQNPWNAHYSKNLGCFFYNYLQHFPTILGGFRKKHARKQSFHKKRMLKRNTRKK